MKKVIVFGTFDKVHPGHISFLSQAKELGNLTVVIGRDVNVKKVKKKKTIHNEEQRKKDIEELNIADNVLLGNIDNKFKVVEEVQPDIIALGYDQNSFTHNLDEELKKRNIKSKIIRLKPYKEDIYKSSKLN